MILSIMCARWISKRLRSCGKAGDGGARTTRPTTARATRRVCGELDVIADPSALRRVRAVLFAAKSNSCRPSHARADGRRSACGPDVERDPPVRLAQRRLDERRALRAREDEAEIGRSFRQRDERPADRGAEADVLDARDEAGGGDAGHAAQDTGAGDRDHHDPGRAGLALQLLDVAAEGAHQDDLLERQTGAEAEGARAQAADAAGGELDEPGAAVVEAQLGVHGTFAQSEGAGGRGGRGRDRLLDARGQARGRDVQSLFEERTVERVRLVEQGQDLETAGDQDPFQGDLDAGNELLDEDETGGVPSLLLDVRLIEQGPDAPEGRDELSRVVGANDAAARGQEGRLEHHREALFRRGDDGRRAAGRPRRSTALWRAARAASGGLCARPRRAQAEAATTAVSSSVGMTAFKWCAASKAAIWPAAFSRSRGSSVTPRVGCRSCRTCFRSDPTTVSTPRRSAARMKSCAR